MFDALGTLLGRRARGRVDTPERLGEFLERNAALLTQKTVIGYVQVKTRLPLSEMLIEKPFADAFETARWQAYAAILADLVVVTEGFLRDAAGGRHRELADALTRLYTSILDRQSIPADAMPARQHEADDLLARLLAAGSAPPLGIAKIAETSARRAFDSLPIHPRLREPDRPAVVAGLQFLMVGLAHEFESQFDNRALVDRLLAGAGGDTDRP